MANWTLKFLAKRDPLQQQYAEQLAKKVRSQLRAPKPATSEQPKSTALLLAIPDDKYVKQADRPWPPEGAQLPMSERYKSRHITAEERMLHKATQDKRENPSGNLVGTTNERKQVAVNMFMETQPSSLKATAWFELEQQRLAREHNQLPWYKKLSKLLAGSSETFSARSWKGWLK